MTHSTLLSPRISQPFQITPVLGTGGAYASGNLFFDATVITGCFLQAGGRNRLDHLFVVDQESQGPAFDLYFVIDNTSLGTVRGALAYGGANWKAKARGRISIASGDWTSDNSVKVADVPIFNRIVYSGSADLYVAAIIRGAATYTGNNLSLNFGFTQQL
jgi:hypothetical protein